MTNLFYQNTSSRSWVHQQTTVNTLCVLPYRRYVSSHGYQISPPFVIYIYGFGKSKGNVKGGGLGDSRDFFSQKYNGTCSRTSSIESRTFFIDPAPPMSL